MYAIILSEIGAISTAVFALFGGNPSDHTIRRTYAAGVLDGGPESHFIDTMACR